MSCSSVMYVLLTFPIIQVIIGAPTVGLPSFEAETGSDPAEGLDSM